MILNLKKAEEEFCFTLKQRELSNEEIQLVLSSKEGTILDLKGKIVVFEQALASLEKTVTNFQVKYKKMKFELEETNGKNKDHEMGQTLAEKTLAETLIEIQVL